MKSKRIAIWMVLIILCVINLSCHTSFTDIFHREAKDIPSGPSNMVWVNISDPGVSGHEGFDGEMSKYEITNAQYCEFLNVAFASGDIDVSVDTVCGSNGSNPGEDYVDKSYIVYSSYQHVKESLVTYSKGTFSVLNITDEDMKNHPVVGVSWYGAAAFCNYYGYRLPTEWEWQAVADYDGTFKYGCGKTINPNKANYDKENPLDLPSSPYVSPVYTTPVDFYPEFGHGLCDMAGNVWEWTDSLYSDTYPFPVIRGGSWHDNAGSCGVSNRGNSRRRNMHTQVGFRVCR